MPSWSQRSPESVGPPGEEHELGPEPEEELRIMRRQVIEALRRAEITSLLTGAESEEELGKLLPEELCEVYDAEVGLVGEVSPGTPARCIGATGIPPDSVGRVLASNDLARAAGAERASVAQGPDLLGIGACASLLCSHPTGTGRRVLIGAARMVDQPFDAPEVALIEAVAVSTAQTLERVWAAREREELIARLRESFLGTAEALANALEAKDDYTANHAGEVADLAVSVGRELGLDPSELEDLRYGAIFHDIGKIAIPDSILNKPGPLDPDEVEVMRRHPEIGAQIVAPIPHLSEQVKSMVLHDHERFDGEGYPAGLAGEAIPLGARIILVVDSFHAMISDRPYRKAMARSEAVAEIERHSGSQFDPRVVAAFLAVIS